MTFAKVNGSTQSLDVHQFSREKLNKWIEFMRTRRGDQLKRLLKKQQTHSPSIQGVWNPFTNKAVDRAAETYPSLRLNEPVNQIKSATEMIAELFSEQNKIQ